MCGLWKLEVVCYMYHGNACLCVLCMWALKTRFCILNKVNLKKCFRVFVPEAVLVGVRGGSSLQPRATYVRLHNSPRMTKSPLILVHVEGGVADEAGARGDLAVARVGVGIPHPTVAWRKGKLYYHPEKKNSNN